VKNLVGARSSSLRLVTDDFLLLSTHLPQIDDVHLSDFNPKLNTSSYVNVVSEDEEKQVAAMGAQINIADLVYIQLRWVFITRLLI